jgi:hypothetical protein
MSVHARQPANAVTNNTAVQTLIWENVAEPEPALQGQAQHYQALSQSLVSQYLSPSAPTLSNLNAPPTRPDHYLPHPTHHYSHMPQPHGIELPDPFTTLSSQESDTVSQPTPEATQTAAPHQTQDYRVAGQSPSQDNHEVSASPADRRVASDDDDTSRLGLQQESDTDMVDEHTAPPAPDTNNTPQPHNQRNTQTAVTPHANTPATAGPHPRQECRANPRPTTNHILNQDDDSSAEHADATAAHGEGDDAHGTESSADDHVMLDDEGYNGQLSPLIHTDTESSDAREVGPHADGPSATGNPHPTGSPASAQQTPADAAMNGTPGTHPSSLSLSRAAGTPNTIANFLSRTSLSSPSPNAASLSQSPTIRLARQRQNNHRADARQRPPPSAARERRHASSGRRPLPAAGRGVYTPPGQSNQRRHRSPPSSGDTASLYADPEEALRTRIMRPHVHSQASEPNHPSQPTTSSEQRVDAIDDAINDAIDDAIDDAFDDAINDAFDDDINDAPDDAPDDDPDDAIDDLATEHTRRSRHSFDSNLSARTIETLKTAFNPLCKCCEQHSPKPHRFRLLPSAEVNPMWFQSIDETNNREPCD